MNSSPLQVLQGVFGYPEFRYQQAEIIDTLLQGGDALVLMPTGGGKSLCYQIPALVRPGVGVVVSPLIALMQDQVNALRQLGIRAAFLNSTLDSRQRYETEQAFLRGEMDLLYVAPERLLMDQMLTLMDRSRIALFAIDEAHCVSQWGHDFRKEYQQLSVLHQRFPEVPRIALTATADERTRREIVEQLDLGRARVFLHSFDRPNIRYTLAEGQGGREALWRFLEREHPGEAGIVYCLSRKKVEATAEWLSARGREALPYHAGLPDLVRYRHQERFLREDGLIIVATIAFGMGIDKPDVRFVAHLSLPKSIEAYYQETGRAGRNGQPADAWMAYGLQDVIILRQMVQESDAAEQFKQVALHKLEAMLGLCELTSCRRQVLLAYFGEHQETPCGNCDNCLAPPITRDARVAAQQALSCVYRTGQRFGVGYLVAVLLGRVDDRIRRNGHDRVSTFGIGKKLTEREWHSLFRQLIARSVLAIDPEGFGALHFTESCRPYLRGEVPLQLRRRQTVTAKKSERRREPGQPHDSVRPQDRGLFEGLRALRKRLAEQQGLPPFAIFHDATLIDLVKRRPASLEGLRGILGIGEIKLQRYGTLLLKCLMGSPPEPK